MITVKSREFPNGSGYRIGSYDNTEEDVVRTLFAFLNNEDRLSGVRYFDRETNLREYLDEELTFYLGGGLNHPIITIVLSKHDTKVIIE